MSHEVVSYTPFSLSHLTPASGRHLGPPDIEASNLLPPSLPPGFETRLGVPIDVHLPVTTMQEQMLIHQLLQPESAVSHMVLVLPLESRCPEPVARASLHALVQRHASLRTIYVETDGMFEQVP